MPSTMPMWMPGRVAPSCRVMLLFLLSLVAFLLLSSSSSPPFGVASASEADDDLVIDIESGGTVHRSSATTSGSRFFPSNFTYLEKDRRLPDSPEDLYETIYYHDICREDLLHSPLVFSVGLEVFGDLRPSFFALSTMILGEEEREALLAFRRAKQKHQEESNRVKEEEEEVGAAARNTTHDCHTSAEGVDTCIYTSPVPRALDKELQDRLVEPGDSASLSQAKLDAPSSHLHVEEDSNVGEAVEDDNSADDELSTVKDDRGLRITPTPAVEAVSSPLTPPEEVLIRLIEGDYLGDTIVPPLRPFTDRYFVHQMELSLVKNHMCDIFVELMHIPNRPPLVITMFNWLTSRFGLRCVFLRMNELRSATRKFVLVAPEGDNAAGNSFFLDEVREDEPRFNVSQLLDFPLLAHWYGVNGQIRHPKFTPTPIGLRSFHLSGETLILDNPINRVTFSEKQRFFTQNFMRGRETKVFVAFSVWDGRRQLFEYLQSPELQAFVAKPMTAAQSDFVTSVHRYAFVVSPIGYGFDCYRTWEALTLGAIPILEDPEQYAGSYESIGCIGALHYQHELQPAAGSDPFFAVTHRLQSFLDDIPSLSFFFSFLFFSWFTGSYVLSCVPSSQSSLLLPTGHHEELLALTMANSTPRRRHDGGGSSIYPLLQLVSALLFFTVCSGTTTADSNHEIIVPVDPNAPTTTTSTAPPPPRPRLSALYPPDYQLLRSEDGRLLDSTEDLYETIFYFDLTREDLLHAPLAFSVGLEVFGDLRQSNFCPSTLILGDEERDALLAFRRQKAATTAPVDDTIDEVDLVREARYYLVDLNNVTVEITPTPAVEAVSSPLTPPEEVLIRLIEGDYLGDTIVPPLRPFTDRYFVHQMELSLVKNHMCDIFVELMHIPNRRPLVVTMFNWHTSRFTMRCLYLRMNALRTATRKFVLVAPEGDNAAGNSFFLGEVAFDPNFNISWVLHHPLLAHWYGINGQIQHPKFTPTPIGNRPFHLSGTSLMQETFDSHNTRVHRNMYTRDYLKGLDLNLIFPHIDHPLQWGREGSVWFEKACELFTGTIVDPPIEAVPFDQLPQRITTIYIVVMPIERGKRPGRPSLTDEVLIIHHKEGNRATAASQHIALLPFTAALYQNLIQHPYGNPSRELKVFMAFSMWDFRKEIFEYLLNGRMASHTHKAETTYHDEFHPESIEGKLECVGSPGALAYRHELQPNAFLDLVKDLPVVIIRQKTEISPANLEKWQAEIYARAMRGEYNLKKLFTQYWMDLIHRGKISKDMAKAPFETLFLLFVFMKYELFFVSSVCIVDNKWNSKKQIKRERYANHKKKGLGIGILFKKITLEDIIVMLGSAPFASCWMEVRISLYLSIVWSYEYIMLTTRMGSIHPPRRWHMYVPIAASSGGEAIGLLPVLVLVTILFLSVGLHQVGMVRAADEAPSSTLTGTFTGSSTSSTHDEFENSNSASLPESFFPPGYAFIPYVDSAPEEDTTIDPDDNLFYSEQAPGDHLHHSLVYHFALEVFTDIRVSPYTLTRTIVGAEEREALFEAQRQEAQEEEKERSKETKVHASRNSVDVVQRHKCDVFTTAFFAPDELLSTLVMGDYPGDDHCLSPFSQLMDRYLAYQGDIVPIPNHICDDFVALMHLPNRRPLVVTSFNWMAGRFAYRCVFLRSHSLRTAKRKFVLLTSEGDNAAVNSFFLYDVMQEKKFNISVFLNHPLLAHWYGNNGGIDHPKFTPIPLGNKVLTLEAFSSLQPFSFGCGAGDAFIFGCASQEGRYRDCKVTVLLQQIVVSDSPFSVFIGFLLFLHTRDMISYHRILLLFLFFF
eukprot:gene5779-4130_t